MFSTRVPLSTYRLQLNKDFTFADSCKILDYLRDLGITDIYASPILTSRRGSRHGYDVTDPTRIDPDLGTEEALEVFREELQKREMGLLLDIVPNHMAASSENAWWMDVLENGPGSPFASYFDIDWHPPSRNLDGKILLPVLGRPFGEVLDNGELKVAFQDGKFVLQYYDSSFPLAPRTYRQLLNHGLDALKESLGEESAQYQEYLGIISALSGLSERGTIPMEVSADTHLKFEAIRERLQQLVKGSKETAAVVRDVLKEFSGKKDDPGSFCNLERLLGEQYYTLAYWQDVNETINYRRFFTITDLVGMRVEDPLVFEATHNLVLRLLPKGAIVGLRIDHIDGLRDPVGYLKRLQERVAGSGPASAAPGAYILVEKILAREEHLPSDWPVSGTTGYDFINFANRVFVQPEGAKLIEETYATFIDKKLRFADVVYHKKKLVMTTLLGVEMRSLGRQLGQLAGQDRYARDLPRHELSEALVETTACLSVYRTYVRNLDLPPEAKHSLEDALREARTRRPHLNSACFDFLRDVLMLLNPPHVLPDQREARLIFVLRWQQFTGPIVAKGLEDTALYVYHPLLSLNEVGGDPQPSAILRDEFYQFIAERQQRWPHSLNASSTHDTKRSEDIRARINVLSEIPEEWQSRLNSWCQQNARHKTEVDGSLVPDRNEEYFLYQTLLGLWPLEDEGFKDLVTRLQSYAVKATREAMVHTRWTRPNLAHEEGLTAFIAAILDPCGNAAFLEDFVSFQKKIAVHGMLNSLGQTLLKITSPGIPDFYQGSELWDFRLVDPDNREPVDFTSRIGLLQRLKQLGRANSIDFTQELYANWRDGRIKLFLIWKALIFRRTFCELFSHGDFRRVEVVGGHSENVVAFLRYYGDDWALVVAPKWLARPSAGIVPDGQERFWKGASIALPTDAPSSWDNIFTGERLQSDVRADQKSLLIENLLRYFPVALLSSGSMKTTPTTPSF
jgi:(1->4)-alpha-D-glucan 1-alpha-D-glucosylmutase